MTELSDPNQENLVSPEQQQPNHENLKVTFLNTSFSGAFDNPESLDELLDPQLGSNAVFGFSEVTKAKRPVIAAALEERGYQVVLPPEDSHLDLVWAVGPELQIEATDAHHFPRNGLRRVASRTGSENYRHVGIQDLTITTPGGNKVRLGQERLSPWVVEPVRRLQIKDMTAVLKEKFPPDDNTILTINGGDMNHINPFRRPDDKMWALQEGWEPVIEKGVPTHSSLEKYSRSERLFRALGRRSSETQLDAAYARPRAGTSLVNLGESPDVTLTSEQIGYTTQTRTVGGTDHYAVETIYSLPISN